MYWLKSCPRCSGDLAEQDDIYGKEVLCMQCGFRPAPVELAQLRRRLAGSTLQVKVSNLAAF